MCLLQRLCVQKPKVDLNFEQEINKTSQASTNEEVKLLDFSHRCAMLQKFVHIALAARTR